MNHEGGDDHQEIEKMAKAILIGARAWGKFPTPVDAVIEYCELSLAKHIDLSKVGPDFLTSSREFFGRICRKVLGMVDLREKVIYLDHSQKPARKNFVKLHEVGHGVIPCQRDLYGCLDDEDTIAPEVKELFENQANHFASSSLFQLERFDESAAKLPLSIRSARALAEKFGGSVQAALRRYVEHSPKRCALIVLHKPEAEGAFRAKIRNYFESPSFRSAFGGLSWPDECGSEFSFVKDIKIGRKDHENGAITVTTRALEKLELEYHFFNNTFNIFILLMPSGEKIESRIKILFSRKQKV